MELFRHWRQHIPHLCILLVPLVQVKNPFLELEERHIGRNILWSTCSPVQELHCPSGLNCRSQNITEQNLFPIACHAAKPIYWHWVVVKEITVLISGCQARRMGCSCSKDLSGKDFQRQYSGWSSPVALREGLSKTTFWVRVAAHKLSSDWLMVRWQGDVLGILIITLLVPTSLGSTVRVSM